MKLIVGITGASGVQYGVSLLELLEATDVETHLVVSERGRQVVDIEADRSVAAIHDLADETYSPRDTAATVASGSADFDAMVVCPCSMKTLGLIANGIGEGLVPRAADVCLKEGRDLVLVPREAPLARTHLQNMLAADAAGARILPAAPGFYTEPATLADLVEGFAAKVLDQVGVETPALRRWDGP